VAPDQGGGAVQAMDPVPLSVVHHQLITDLLKQ
jgi:hypothetical protein